MRSRTVRLLTLLGDMVAITVAFEAAVRLRVALNPLFQAQIAQETMAYLVPPLGLVLTLWVPASAWVGLYQPKKGPPALAAAIRLAEAMVLVTVLTIVATFFLRDFGRDFSRAFIIFLATLGIATMMAVRTLIWLVIRVRHRRGLDRERVLIIGRGRFARSLIRRLERGAGRAVEAVGVVTPSEGESAGILGNPIPVIGTVERLPAIVNRYGINRVIAVEKEVPPESLFNCISVCTRMGIPLNHTSGMLQVPLAEIGVTEIGDISLLEVRGFQFSKAQEAAKRVFDLLGAGLLLLALSPLMMVLAVLIRLTSPGPILYIAPRVGRGGRHFRFFKFRSMVRDAEAKRDELKIRNEKKSHLFKIRSDPRITRVGRFMRRFSLDELPQLLNVLRGEMSLVGPRPLPACDLEPDGLSREYRFWAKERVKVLPGITGLWQVRGRSDLGLEEMLRLDVAHVRTWSLRNDLMILLRTIPIVMTGRGAC
ncbi:MAG: sugar transferase [Gemmatimonadota bacterium]